ncbi:MAG: PQQ-binding-like beta-propeller repeat protein, partial [Planctomycetes bacterium]|nr:PQQ-binding-like beta-propeller repeat protein [Planctomycetota bacterium]
GYGGTIYAMDKGTGKLRWTAAVGNGVDRFLNSSPISDGKGRIYSGNHHTFACFDVVDGSLIWERRIYSEFAASCDQPVYDADSHRILITQVWQKSTAHIKGRDVTGECPILDAETGVVVHLHKKDVVKSFGLTPCVHDGHVYSAQNGMNGSVLGKNTVVWQNEINGQTSGAITMCKHGLVLPTADGCVSMIDPKNGFEIWSLKLGLAPVIAQIYAKTEYASISDLTEKGAHIYFTAQDKFCYKVHTASGKVLSKIALPEMSLCRPLIHKEGIILSDYNGNVHCLKGF